MLICLCTIIFMTGFRIYADDGMRNENLAKLCKVWGFVKYTHHSFISGQLDWDEELLNLIPIIYSSDAEDVNGILYEWFVGLGDDKYDLRLGHDFDWSGRFAEMGTWLDEHESLDEATLEERGLLIFIVEYREKYEFFTALLDDGYNLDWRTYETMMREMFPLVLWHTMRSHVQEPVVRTMADLSWINVEYLGPLAAHLLRFDGISVSDRTAAPVFFDPVGTANFSNQNNYAHMDFNDAGYRLLGLFRMWKCCTITPTWTLLTTTGTRHYWNIFP
jgi:hypothetical protein